MVRTIEGNKIEVLALTTEQLKRIDANLDTGASQEPGYYWWEKEVGRCSASGPYPTAEAAFTAAKEF